jgi:hypothetical protein
MEGVGITNGCAMVLVAKTKMVMVKAQSAIVDRLVLE